MKINILISASVLYSSHPCLKYPTAIQSGYANLKQLQHIIDVTRKGNTDVFGGIALWEASTAFLNKQSGVSMAQGVKNYLKKVGSGSSSGGSPSKSGGSCTKKYVSKAGDKCYKVR